MPVSGGRIGRMALDVSTNDAAALTDSDLDEKEMYHPDPTIHNLVSDNRIRKQEHMNLIRLDVEEPLTKGPRRVWFNDFNVDDWTELDWSMLRRCENSRKKSKAPMDISPEG